MVGSATAVSIQTPQIPILAVVLRVFSILGMGLGAAIAVLLLIAAEWLWAGVAVAVAIPFGGLMFVVERLLTSAGASDGEAPPLH